MKSKILIVCLAILLCAPMMNVNAEGIEDKIETRGGGWVKK